jgi:hypothetical protein
MCAIDGRYRRQSLARLDDPVAAAAKEVAQCRRNGQDMTEGSNLGG